MSELLVKNCLFFTDKRGEIQDTWSLFADDANDEYRQRATDWNLSHGMDTILFTLNNEGKTSMFKKAFMGELNWDKLAVVDRWLRKWQSHGFKIVPAFYDGPQVADGKYHPIIDRPMEQHQAFLKAAVGYLNQFAVGYVLGCETNRYWGTSTVNTLVETIKSHAAGKPVGTHMCWDPSRYDFPQALDFWAHEFRWSPRDGDEKSAAECVAEIKDRISKAPAGRPCWASEYNIYCDGNRIKEQSRALAAVEGVYGIGGQM